MSPFTYVAMYGFVPLALWLFGKYPPRIAAAAVFVVGWCFLPQASFVFPVLPDYTKTSALGVAALIGILVKDQKALKQFKFSWIDIPVVCWCFAPFMASMTNGLGAYDGLSAVLGAVWEWWIPYFVGRLYFGTLETLKILGIAMFLGALVLAPLAVYEMIMSPQMHIMLYGWFPHDFSQTKRGGGYRPSLFMEHGLELAIWMVAGLFLGWQMMLQGTLKKTVPLLRIPLLPSVLGLTLVTVASRSSGALMLWIFAMGTFISSRILRLALPFFIMVSLPVLYMNLRASGSWDGQSLVEAAQTATGSEKRAGSLAYRIHNETMLVEKAQRRQLFGWAGYQRSFVTNELGEYISVPDGMWILTYGKYGLFGLTALTLTVLLAPIIFALKWPAKTWGDPLVAPAAAFSILLGVTMIDNLFNAMYNPVMTLALGGLASLVTTKQKVKGIRDLEKTQNPEPLESEVPATRVI